MGHNGKDEIHFHEIEASQCASAMVEIKIKTLDSQTYTLRVDKCVSVPALKEQVASVTGVVTEQQRLICRGRVLKDDQLLSAYHVEDGHTLHLVVRQPIPPLSESSTSNAAADPALSAGESQGSQRSRVVVGSFNIDQADGVYSDLGQIVSAVLGSLGVSNPEGVIEGIEAMGPLHERLSGSSAPSTARADVTENAVDQTSTPLTSSQPTAIPDSLTTLSEYLNHLRQEFAANGSNATNLQDSESSMENVQDNGSSTGEIRIPRPSHLAEVLQTTRQLLIGEVADYLSNLSRQVEDHVNVTDPSTRRLCQANMLQSGSLLDNLGMSLLELGRATMMLRLGQTPDDAVVSAGPAVFISPTGRNLLPSQASRLGTSTGGLQPGTTHSSPFAGQSLVSAPRNIEIRIRTGANGTYQQLHQPLSESYRQPQSVGTSGREGDSNSAPRGQGFPASRTRIRRYFRALSRRILVQTGSWGPLVNPFSAESTERNEAVANAQVEQTQTRADDGIFISNVLQQIMPFISQNVPSSSSVEAGSNSSRQASSREEEEGAERGRPEPPLPPESKRQKRD